MLSLLWDGQRDDAARIKELKRECNELSNENAALQLDCFEKPHVTRIPQEVVVTETGRRYTPPVSGKTPPRMLLGGFTPRTWWSKQHMIVLPGCFVPENQHSVLGTCVSALVRSKVPLYRVQCSNPDSG